MPGLDPMNGLGGVMPPDQQTNAPQGGGSSWTDLLNNPMAKSALLGFSLQALTGGWGNGIQQLGQALGAGTESAQGTAQAMEKEGVRQAESAQQAELAREGMASHEKVAEITGGSREAAAEIRGRYSVDRAHVMLGKASADQQAKYIDMGRKVVESNPANMTLDPITKSQMIREEAARLYTAAQDMKAHGFTPDGEAAPPPASPGPSTKSSDAGGDDGMGGTVPPAKTAAPAKGGSAPAAEPTGPKKPAFWDAYRDPRVQEMLSTPEGQQKLLKLRPDFKSNIDSYNRMRKEQQDIGR